MPATSGAKSAEFLLETSAMSFAREKSRPSGCATISIPERFELDLENSGNPLVEHLGGLMHLIWRVRRRMAAFIGNVMEAIKRRLKGFDVL